MVDGYAVVEMSAKGEEMEVHKHPAANGVAVWRAGGGERHGDSSTPSQDESADMLFH